MAKQGWTKMSKSLLMKLIYRGVLFISALVYYIVFLVLGGSYKNGSNLFGDIDTVPVWRTTVHRGRKESDKTEVTEHACMHDLRFTLNVIECRRF